MSYMALYGIFESEEEAKQILIDATPYLESRGVHPECYQSTLVALTRFGIHPSRLVEYLQTASDYEFDKAINDYTFHPGGI